MSMNLLLSVAVSSLVLFAGAARADCPDGYCDDGYTLAQHGEWNARKEAERKARWAANTDVVNAAYSNCMARSPYVAPPGYQLQPAFQQAARDFEARCRQEASTPPRDFEPVDQSRFPN